MSKEEFIKVAVNTNGGVQNDSTNVWCEVDGIQANVDHGIVESEPFQVSVMLENNPDHELWDELYDDYLKRIE